MRRVSCWGWILWAGIFGCSSNDVEFERLVGVHAENIEEIRDLSRSHAQAVASETERFAILELEEEHKGRMNTALARMRTAIGDIDACLDFCCMHAGGMMHGMTIEVAQHHERMEDALYLVTAREEEDRHQIVIAIEIERMLDDHRGMRHMMETGMDMGCPSAE